MLLPHTIMPYRPLILPRPSYASTPHYYALLTSYTATPFLCFYPTLLCPADLLYCHALSMLLPHTMMPCLPLILPRPSYASTPHYYALLTSYTVMPAQIISNQNVAAQIISNKNVAA